jgi:hypothetical protein
MAGYGSSGPWSEQQAYGPSGYQAYPVAPRNDTQAGWALGLSIFSLLCCSFLAPVAIILAIQSQRRIDASGGYLTGRGMATAGLVIGVIGCVLLALNLMLIISGNSMWYYG